MRIYIKGGLNTERTTEMLIDTHAHVNFSAFKEDAEDVLRRSLDQGIWVINVGSEYKTSKRAVEMAEKYESGVFAVVGLHPGHLGEHDIDDGEGHTVKSKIEKFDPEKYRELAKSRRVVAIGECGLDYYFEKSKVKGQNSKLQLESQNLEEIIYLQKNTFREEIKLAVDLDLPVMVHCRNAYKDVLELVIEEKKKYGSKLRGTIHSYLGRLSYAEEFNKLGFLISFNGVITYARDYDKVIRGVGLEHILTETDCPWLTPVPHRGERNEPSYVRFVAEKIAEIRAIDADEVSKNTVENAKRLFRL